MRLSKQEIKLETEFYRYRCIAETCSFEMVYDITIHLSTHSLLFTVDFAVCSTSKY
jgi:hypothetical protein